MEDHVGTGVFSGSLLNSKARLISVPSTLAVVPTQVCGDDAKHHSDSDFLPNELQPHSDCLMLGLNSAKLRRAKSAYLAGLSVCHLGNRCSTSMHIKRWMVGRWDMHSPEALAKTNRHKKRLPLSLVL